MHSTTDVKGSRTDCGHLYTIPILNQIWLSKGLVENDVAITRGTGILVLSALLVFISQKDNQQPSR